MNKPVAQLELVPAAAAEPTTSSLNPKLVDALTRAGVDAAGVDRVAAATGSDDFDWDTDDSVVVKPRHGVAIYENKSGNVVIRSQNTYGDEDDFSFITPEGLPAVIKALKDWLP
jgi:hypothetical protein